MEQYIYILLSQNGLCKIGIASAPERRIRDLNTINSVPLLPIYVSDKPFQDARALETKLHTQFTLQRVNGEWFQLSTQDIYKAIRIVQEALFSPPPSFSSLSFQGSYQERETRGYCEVCGKPLFRKGSKTCSQTCRTRKHRAQKRLET